MFCIEMNIAIFSFYFFLSSCGKSGSVARAEICLKEYASFALAEEAVLKQKSRNKWLQLGDQNTSYFHKIVKVRNSKNNLSHLLNERVVAGLKMTD